jgi:molybdopterin converting factor small subunit
MPVVRIPTVLRKHTDGAAKVDADGATVGEVFSSLIGTHPGLGDQLLADGQVRGDGLDSPVEPDYEVAIMPAVAGGS